MAGENKKVKRYRRKLVEQNKKMNFMTNLIMNKDSEIEMLRKSIDTLTEGEDDAKQDGETDTEGEGDHGDTETIEASSESTEG